MCLCTFRRSFSLLITHYLLIRSPSSRMKIALSLVLLFAVGCSAECIPFTNAPKHLGETRCVTGKVINIGESRGGTLYLNFCDDYKKCAFAVVVFPSALRDVGDVRQLKDKSIEIHGKIPDWRGRTEMVLKDVRQLKGESAKIPP